MPKTPETPIGKNNPAEFSMHYEPGIRELGQDFYNSVISTGRFSWMGLYQTTDPLKRPALVIMLKESDTPIAPPPEHLRRSQDMVGSFVELSRALRASNVFLNLYYYRPQTEETDPKKFELNVRKCVRTIFESGMQKPRVRPLWSGSVLPTNTVSES